MEAGLLARCSSACGTSWVWADEAGRRSAETSGRQPSDAELAACGFAGSEWLGPPSRNLLLLLHGLGDSPAPFSQLARRMALPDTSALALRAPLPLPLGLDGFMWHPSFDDEGELLPPARPQVLAPTRHALAALIELLERCGWPSHRIFLFGFSQGGTTAIDTMLHARCRLGGVVSVCGHLLPAQLPARRLTSEVRTALLVIAATRDQITPISDARRAFGELRAAMGGEQEAVLREVPRGHGMVCSAAEMRLVMEFFAERLELHATALERDPTLIRLDGSEHPDVLERLGRVAGDGAAHGHAPGGGDDRSARA